MEANGENKNPFYSLDLGSYLGIQIVPMSKCKYLKEEDKDLMVLEVMSSSSNDSMSNHGSNGSSEPSGSIASSSFSHKSLMTMKLQVLEVIRKGHIRT